MRLTPARTVEHLGADDRKRTRETVQKLVQDAGAPGLRWHYLAGSKFLSLSPSLGVRVIAQQVGDRVILLHADRHDAAYAWASRRELQVDPRSDILEVVTVLDRDQAESVPIEPGNRYGKELMERMLANHFPPHIASALQECRDDDDVLQRIEAMSRTWQDVILRVAAGERLASSDIPGPESSIRVLRDDADLSAALRLPVTAWRSFLHPRQRAAAEDLGDKVVSVVGGPGTGKSVVCIHRAAFLAGHMPDNEAVVMLTLAVGLKDQLQDQVEQVLAAPLGAPRRVFVLSLPPGTAKKTGEFPVRIVGKEALLDTPNGPMKTGAIIVDEFHDYPNWVMEYLERIHSETNCKYLTVAMDTQQAIFRIDNRVKLSHFLREAKEFYLPYSYRMTKQILDHSFAVLDKYMDVYADRLNLDAGIRKPIASTSGPEVKYVEVQNIEEMVRKTRSIIQDLETRFDEPESLAVIHLQYWSPHFHRKRRIDPVTEALKRDDVIGKYYQFGFWTKGKEFFAGVIALPENFMVRDLGLDNLLRLNTLFVVLTRFRDELTIVYNPNSPAARYLAVKE